MQKRIVVFVPVLMVVFALLVAGSCKKESAQDKPATFDESLDGVAVRPLPVMDIKLAERIKRDGPVSPVADVTDESVLASAATAESAAGGGGVEGYNQPTEYVSSDPNNS